MKNQKVKKMVGVSLLCAVIVVLQLLSAVMPIKLGPVSISLVLIPIVLGAAVYGPGAGAILGAAFGLIATICCINGMDAGGQMVFQANPLMCIVVVMLKGTLAGLISGLTFKVLHRKIGFPALFISAAICPIVNTGVFLLGMKLYFMDVLRIWAGGSDVAAYVLSGLILINFLPELALNLILAPASYRVIRAVKR